MELNVLKLTSKTIIWLSIFWNFQVMLDFFFASDIDVENFRLELISVAT